MSDSEATHVIEAHVPAASSSQAECETCLIGGCWIDAGQGGAHGGA